MPDENITGDAADGSVWLSPLTVADAGEMVGVLAGAGLYAFTGGRPPTLAELRATYSRQAAGGSADGSQEWRNWIIRRQPDAAAVGYCQATIVDGGNRAEIAWVVGLDWQQRGYATEAAQALVTWLDARGVGTIQAHIHPGHVVSAAVARRAGLRPTSQFDDGEQLWRRERAGPRAAAVHNDLHDGARD